MRGEGGRRERRRSQPTFTSPTSAGGKESSVCRSRPPWDFFRFCLLPFPSTSAVRRCRKIGRSGRSFRGPTCDCSQSRKGRGHAGGPGAGVPLYLRRSDVIWTPGFLPPGRWPGHDLVPSHCLVGPAPATAFFSSNRRRKNRLRRFPADSFYLLFLGFYFF